uniref:Large ribosomal subunit protein bL20c n=1 Tax=Pterocladiophila hemisphaerica TaxID=2712948 RepID=A0A6M3WWN5_9FLOR|nr:ribosomal protein L20 [Pterocladiophila hemisphaerica]
MTRIKRGNIAKQRRNKVLKLTRGQKGTNSKLFRVANQQLLKALKSAYFDRKKNKRNYRSLWIANINAKARNYNLTYNLYIHQLKQINVGLNRKMLSFLSNQQNYLFYKLMFL